jgi:hypothetical protein
LALLAVSIVLLAEFLSTRKLDSSTVYGNTEATDEFDAVKRGEKLQLSPH